jgi:hypothetical protein
VSTADEKHSDPSWGPSAWRREVPTREGWRLRRPGCCVTPDWGSVTGEKYHCGCDAGVMQGKGGVMQVHAGVMQVCAEVMQV